MLPRSSSAFCGGTEKDWFVKPGVVFRPNLLGGTANPQGNAQKQKSAVPPGRRGSCQPAVPVRNERGKRSTGIALTRGDAGTQGDP